MRVIYHKDVPVESFPDGATYQTLVGDNAGSTPVRVGIQVSPPGYGTPTHSHPYMEILTILEGTGEAWAEGQEGVVRLEPGVTLVLPPNLAHWFRNTGREALTTYGVHVSPERTVHVHGSGD